MFGEISLVLHLSIRVFRATLIDDGLEKYRQGSKHFQVLQVFFFFFPLFFFFFFSSTATLTQIKGYHCVSSHGSQISQ